MSLHESSLRFSIDPDVELAAPEIDGLVAGDVAELRVRVYGLEPGDDIPQAAFTAKVAVADADDAETTVQAIVRGTTTDDQDTGIFAVPLAPRERLCVFRLTSAETTKLLAATTYNVRFWVVRNGQALMRSTLNGTITAVTGATGETTLTFIGSGAVTLPGLEVRGEGVQRFKGSGAITAPALAIAGTGKQRFRGSGGISRPLAIAGTGDNGLFVDYHAGDSLAAATFSRTGMADYRDASDDAQVASSGAPRDGHHAPVLTAVTLIGDSITANLSPFGGAGLKKWFGLVARSWVNAGISGNTSAQVLARVGTDVSESVSTVCRLLVGINDLRTGVSQATIQSNITAIVANLVSRGITPVLSTVHPVTAAYATSDPATLNGQVEALNTWIRSFATTNGYALSEQYAAFVGGDGFGTAAYYDADGLHPNATGQAVQVAADQVALGTHATLTYGRSLLLGAERTNLFLQSVMPGSGSVPTSWQKPNPTHGVTAPAVSVFGAADGAQAWTTTATADRPFFLQQVAIAANTTYVFSAEIEAVSGGLAQKDVLFVYTLPAGASWGYGSGGQDTPAIPGLIWLWVTTAGTAGTMGWGVGAGCIGAVTGSVTFSRPQLEAGTYPSAFIPTTTAAAPRNADAISLPLPSGATPQTLTLYGKIVEYGTILGANDARLAILGDTTGTGWFGITQFGGKYVAKYRSAAASITATAAVAPSLLDTVELRAVLVDNEDGTLTVTLGQSINGAAEVVVSTTATATLEGTFNAARCNLNGTNGGTTGTTAVRRLLAARGSKSRTTVRSF